VRFDPDHGKAWFCLAALYRATRRSDEALHALREVVRIKPTAAVAWRDLARIHTERGQHQKAVTALRKVLDLQPENVGAWLILGRACIALSHPEGLATVLEKIRSLHPPTAEKLAREYSMAPVRRPAPSSSAPSPTDKAETRLQDATSFDAWLLTIDRPQVAPFGPVALQSA
jgi:tetratricopeptide (TPR) repeat protein